MSSASPTVRVFSAVLLTIGCVSFAWGQSGPLRPVALTGTDGDYGPQLGAGVTFSNFTADPNQYVWKPSAPAVNNSGELVTLGTLTGTGVDASNNAGVWAYRHGQLACLARRGELAPDLGGGETFKLFGGGQAITGWAAYGGFVPTICDSGAVSFVAVLAGDGVSAAARNDDAIFRDTGGTLELVLREGTAVPDHAGDTFTQSAGVFNLSLTMADDGTIGTFTNTANSRGVLTTVPGGVQMLMYKGDALPPPYEEADWGNTWIESLMMADGTTAIIGENTNGAAVGFSRAAWSVTGATAAPVVTQSGSIDDLGYRLGVNAAGRVSFTDDGDMGNGSKLYTTAQFGVPFVIAQHNVVAPGTTSAYSALDGVRHAVGDDGTTVFIAPLLHDSVTNDTNDTGIWSNRSGVNVGLELRQGDAAPGGSTFAEFKTACVNAAGRLAVCATLANNTSGVWVQDGSGVYQSLVHTFEMFDVFGDGSDMRLITEIYILGLDPTPDSAPTVTGTGDGRPVALNDNSDVALRLRFSDGSEGIFTTATAPEYAIGDVNCDGSVNLFDVAPFVVAVSDPDGYAVQYPNCDLMQADIDQSGVVDLFDIDPFVTCVVEGGCP